MRIFYSLLLTAFAVFTFSPVQAYEENSFFNNRLIVVIPSDLTPMPDEIIAQKYIRQNPPKYVYSDETTKISLALKVIKKPAPNMTAAQFGDAMKQVLPKILPIVSWQDEPLVVHNDASIAELAFQTPALESDDYNIMNFMFFIVGTEDVFMVNFNCTTDLLNRCKAYAASVKSSMQLNPRIY